MRKFCPVFLIAILLSQQLFAQVPTISSFSPASGPIGTLVTITGTNFSSTAANNIVFFGAVRAVVVTATETSVAVKVPAGATYQKLSITTNNNLTAYSAQPFLKTFPENVAQFSTSTFSSTVDFATNDYPRDVVISDFNNDGKPDMAVANQVANNISIYKNKTVDTVPLFDSSIDYETNSGPINMSAGDLDGDGDIDLVVANFNAGLASEITIYRNISTNGNIQFDPKISIPTGNGSVGIDIADFNEDGKPDIIVTSSNSGIFSIFKNISTLNVINFDAKQDIDFYRGDDIITGDIDGDNKIDIIVTNTIKKGISIFRNTSTTDAISFAVPIDLPTGDYPTKIILGDLNEDGNTEIVVLNYVAKSFSVLKNTSAPGLISFEQPVVYSTIEEPADIAICDLDGDAKPDIVTGYSTTGVIAIFKNLSTAGEISFATKVDYSTGNYSTYIAAGDLTGDGRPDIAVTNSILKTVSVLTNKIGIVNPLILCPPSANTTITSGIAGASYQWQVNNGVGFSNISDNSIYAAYNTRTLQLNNILSSSNGFQYRCIVDGNSSEVYELKFVNSWTGGSETAWDNPANWSCGAAPDRNTDVVVNSGTLVINSNIIINSLIVNPGATVTVNPGFNLTILHTTGVASKPKQKTK